MHRFFENIELQNGDITQLNYENSCKIIKVLKLKINQQIYLFNNTNFEFLSKIIKIANKIVYVQIINNILNNIESPLKIHLGQALAKHDNMDFIVQKTTELGISEITPFISDRTIVKPKNYSNKFNHWEKIAIGACAQSGRNIVPNINNILTFKDFIQISNNLSKESKYLKLILSTSFSSNNNKQLFNNNLNTYKKILVIIGPEGGFTQEELTLATKNNFYLINLGPRILRTETAAITIIGILQSKFGDILTI